ncbi:MAG: tRNA-dihydrouridine synthase family protein [Desulfovibrionaceae bacterium]|nr:tRNA-dihydrouridine synthase family protein [Desulfovibrionaceae bacterium]
MPLPGETLPFAAACREGVTKTAPLPFTPHAPWLAPLAGYSDLVFRLLCRENGAAVCCTEMISAKGLIHKSQGTAELLRTHPLDAPLVLQLFGNEPDSVARAMEILLSMGFTYFDLNMGCAVPKVTRGGSGAALLRDIPKALAVAKAMFALAKPGHVGCKLRLGWENRDETWRVLAPALADAGAGWLALHPRSARQGFTGSADWNVFAELAAVLSIPVIASGDLMNAEDGVRCLAAGGPSCVMYARGALRDPAIFNAHKALLAGCAPIVPRLRELRRRIERHAELARTCCRRGERGALLQMRSLVPRYVHHLPGVRLLRQALSRCKNWKQFEDIIEDFFKEPL